MAPPPRLWWAVTATTPRSMPTAKPRLQRSTLPQYASCFPQIRIPLPVARLGRRPVCLQPLIHSTLVGARAPRQRLPSHPADLSPNRLIRRCVVFDAFPLREPLSASFGNVRCQRPRNGGLDPGICGFDRFREYVRDVAVPADQVLVEVPPRNILRPRLRRPFVERMRVRPLHDRLGRDRKGDLVILRGCGDFGRAARFLVRRNRWRGRRRSSGLGREIRSTIPASRHIAACSHRARRC